MVFLQAWGFFLTVELTDSTRHSPLSLLSTAATSMAAARNVLASRRAKFDDASDGPSDGPNDDRGNDASDGTS